MRASESVARAILAPSLPATEVMATISQVNGLVQSLTRRPLNEALRECTHLLAGFDRLSEPERAAQRRQIALVRRHCALLRVLARASEDLQAIEAAL